MRTITKTQDKNPTIKRLFHPTLFLLIAWFVAINPLGLVNFVFVILSHELGHYYVAKKLGYKLDSFCLAPYGVSLNYRESVFDPRDEVLIALAGPLVNIFLAAFVVCFWWLTPEIYGATYQFVFQSVLLGLFNLLPAYPLDGGRIFVGFVSEKMPRKRAVKIIVIANLIFSACFLSLFVISCFTNFNPTFALASIFMLGGVIQSRFESKYQVMNVFKKKIKNYSRPINLVVEETVTLGQLIKHIQPNKFTVFFVVGKRTRVVDERLVLDLSLMFPYSMEIGEILIKIKRG